MSAKTSPLEDMIDLENMHVFATVAREGSITGATDVLDMSYATINRRIAAFETDLGTALFIRQHGSLKLTTEGEEVMSAARRIFGIADSLERRLEGMNRKLEGEITVTLSRAVLTGILMPHLDRFQKAHPGIDVEFDTSRVFKDIGEGDADIAVRFTDNHMYRLPENLIGRRLPDIHVSAYVRQDLLRNGQPPGNMGWIKWDRRMNFMKLREPFDRDNRPVTMAIDDITVQTDAVRAGLGMAILPCFLGDAADGLVRACPDVAPQHALDAWVVAHPDMRNVERIRSFIKFTGDCFEKKRDLILGNAAQEIGGN